MDINSLTLPQVVELAATDHELYCKVFFPETFRQEFSESHTKAWNLMDSTARQVNILMPRGYAKTTNARVYTSKTIAYGLSRTLFYLSKSEGHAIRSTTWLQTQVEHNTAWAQAFGLRKGRKWQPIEFEIIVNEGTRDEHSCWAIASGISGSVRGVNIGDYRPDTIMLDDILDDENSNTPEQRQKIEKRVYGAILESLAPESEAPHAKIISLATPQDSQDYAVKALKDPSWKSLVVSCWSEETRNLPADQQVSGWPDRFPTEVLRKEKQAALARGSLATFLREKECKLTSPDKTPLRLELLNAYNKIPEGVMPIYAIDPVPPPSDAAIAKGLVGLDMEAHVVWGLKGSDFYLLDLATSRGHEPDWTVAKFFEFQRKWRPVTTLVESVAYQRVLLWLLKKAMDSARQWFAIEEFQDRRSKYIKILTALKGPLNEGKLFYNPELHVDFAEQLTTYPDSEHDDILDASAMVISRFLGLSFNSEGHLVAMYDEADKYEPIIRRACP